MSAKNTPAGDVLMNTLRHTVIRMVSSSDRDLSSRQLAVLLTCYLNDTPQTVRGLAATLNVSKPAITRALDRLEQLEMVRRKMDPMDHRSIYLVRTNSGKAYMKQLQGQLTAAAAEAGARRSGSVADLRVAA
jgi:DNA-binding MarR family transcriptional regulator